jgi:ABC-2 type transport system permease protein
MRTLRFLLQKEFLQIFRNPSILRIMIAVPIIQLLILPLAADFEIKNINVAIVDHDHSAYSRDLVSRIIASGYFRLAGYGESFAEAYLGFEEDRSDLILEIPEHFEKDLTVSREASLFLAVNAINGTKANVGSSYISRIIAAYNADLRLKSMTATKWSPVPVIEVASSNWFNPLLNYRYFMVPGILVLLVTMVGSYMCAVNIVKEKEVGTIEQINVTPIRKQLFILGKIIPFWIIGMILFSFGLLVIARFVYGITVTGSLPALYAFLSIYLVAVLGIGLLISTYSVTQQQSMSLAFFCIMIFLLMGGLFTPVDSMPEWAKWIARVNPVTYFIDVMRMVVLKGSRLADIQKHLLMAGGFAVFFNLWAMLNYKKTS